MRGDSVRSGHWAALALLTAAGATLRLIGAAEAPLWTDEALTLVIVNSGYADLFFGGIDPTGGLYYALHKALVPDGAGLAGIRAVSIVCGTLLIPVLFAAARSAAGVRAGLAAAALTAVFPPLVDYSQEARTYALLLLLIGLSVWGLIGWSRDRDLRHLILFAAATVLALYCHPTAIVWIGPATAWLALRAGSERRRVSMTLMVMLALAIPEVLRVFRYAEQGGTFAWLEQESLAGAARILAEATLPFGWGRAVPAAGWIAAIAVLGWIAWRLASSRAELHRWAAANATAATGVAILLAVPAGLWLLGFVGSPVLMLRTALPATMGAVVALAVLATVGQPARAAMAQVAGLVLLYGGSLIVGGSERPAEPWDRVAAMLAANAQPGDAVLVCPYWRGPALYAALDELEQPPAAPVLLVHRGKVHRLLAAGADGWREAYHQRIFAADWPQVAENPLQLRSGESNIRRLWLLDSECVDVERQAIVEWAGEGQWRGVAVLPASDGRSDIAVDLFAPPAPLSKELALPARPFRSRTAR